MRQNLKYYFLLIIGGILFYQMTEKPQFLFGFFSFITNLLTPFWIGLFLAIILNPIVRWCEKKVMLKRSISILLTYLSMVFLVGACLMIILPSLITGINNLFIEMTRYFNQPNQWINELNFNVPYAEEIMPFIQGNFHSIIQNIMAILNGLSTSLLTSIIELTSQLFNLIFGVTISVYLIIDQERVMRSFRQGISIYLPEYDSKINYFVTYAYYMFQDYIVGRLLDSLIIGVIAYIGFMLIGSPYVSLFAFIIFITNIIPYFGPIIGAIIPILMSFLISPIQAIWVAVFILLLQQLDGNVIGPKIMGDRVGLSPLWVISSVILGGALFGFIGFFLAVPVAAVLKEVYDQSLNDRLIKRKSRI